MENILHVTISNKLVCYAQRRENYSDIVFVQFFNIVFKELSLTEQVSAAS